LSLVAPDSDGSPHALQEVLYLYDFLDSLATRKQIMGIEKVTSNRVVRQTGSRIGAGLVRGLETTIEFDEEQYVGSGVFLFASVLERFLGLYASVNSFNQLVAKSKQREGFLKRWAPRTGEQILL
jgi:type VI secretion system protein ImpG